MEEVEFEDGSALSGSDACVVMVRDDEGVWSNAVPGYMYADADGDPWIGCEIGTPVFMPNTSMDEPGPGLFGLVPLLFLLSLALISWYVEERRKR